MPRGLIYCTEPMSKAERAAAKAEGDAWRALEAENKRLREAATLAIKIIDANLYHQREKVVDAASLLRQALDPL